MHKLFGKIQAKSTGLGPRQIRVVASDATPDRAGDILEPGGCDLSEYRKNPIVLSGHDPDCPVGTADIGVAGGRVVGVITFAPEGASEEADETCALAKAGILRAVSVGFLPLEAEPIRGGGMRFRRWKLLELSVVSIPANPNALVIERSLQKSGRAISAANAAKIAAARDAVEQAHAHLCDLLADGDGDEKRIDIEHYRRKARLVDIAAGSHGAVSAKTLELYRRKALAASIKARIA